MANDFLPFSTSGTANVYTNAEYTADADHTNGNQPGIAKSKLVNKALRQCSIISTVVAQYIADITGTNAVDDGTTATLLTNLKTATNVAYNTHAATSKVTPVAADEIPIIDSAASNGLKKLTFANLATYFTSLFAPIASPTFTGTPSLPTGTIAVTQTAGDNSTKVATTAFTKAQSESVAIGTGQTWQDVTASRVSGTTYTNSTGKPIMVTISTTQGTNPIQTLISEGLIVFGGITTASNSAIQGCAIIRNGATYLYSGTIARWLELR